MSNDLKEILLGVAYSIVTMLFMVGLLPWAMVSYVMGCVVAMLAIIRIRKRKNNGEAVVHFTVSYMAVVILCILLLNSLSISA